MSYDLKDLAPSVRAYINRASLPMKSIGLELSDLDPYEGSVIEGVQKWISLVNSGKVIKAQGEQTCGMGLLLVGNPGHGKTTLASTALQELLRGIPRDVIGTPERFPIRPGYFTDYPRFLRLQKRQWDPDADETEASLVEGLYGDAPDHLNVKILVLDDLGKEYRTASGWAENTFDALLRARFNAGLPTIITTNYSLDKWDDMYGESMGSFGHEAFVPINVVSEKGDRRRWA